MARRGLVQIDRGVFNHPVFSREPYTEREAWIWMIMEASYEARPMRVLNKIVELDRGQFAASLRFMAERFQWKKDKVARFIKKLTKEGMLETDITTGETIVSICNYEVYQDFNLYRETATETDARQQRDSSATGARQTKIKSKLNTNPREGASKGKANRATRLNEDWRPDAEGWQYATDQGLDEQTTKREFEKFQNYWLSRSGSGATKTDWGRTWRNWCLRAIENKSSVLRTIGGANTSKGGSVYTNFHDAAGSVVKRRANERGDF